MGGETFKSLQSGTPTRVRKTSRTHSHWPEEGCGYKERSEESYQKFLALEEVGDYCFFVLKYSQNSAKDQVKLENLFLYLIKMFLQTAG